MTRRSRTEPQALAEARSSLKWLLDAIVHGELTAGPGWVAKLEGAVAALDVVIKVTPGRPRGGLWSGVRSQPGAAVHSRDGLQRVLEAIHRGELTAGSGYVARLEGAIAALDALLDDGVASGGGGRWTA